MTTDNDSLHSTHDLLTSFEEYQCGCVFRSDGERLRYCQGDKPRLCYGNPKKGTHGKLKKRL